MGATDELQRIAANLYGTRTNQTEFERLAAVLSPELAPPWLAAMLETFPLAGVCFSLTEEEDESELGADLKWFSAEQIVEEATQAYPGRVVAPLGYLPIAACLAGSGDPYFLKLTGGASGDPPLVRVPHDLVKFDDSYPEGQIELVCGSLGEFFRKASVD